MQSGVFSNGICIVVEGGPTRPLFEALTQLVDGSMNADVVNQLFWSLSGGPIRVS